MLLSGKIPPDNCAGTLSVPPSTATQTTPSTNHLLHLRPRCCRLHRPPLPLPSPSPPPHRLGGLPGSTRGAPHANAYGAPNTLGPVPTSSPTASPSGPTLACGTTTSGRGRAPPPRQTKKALQSSTPSKPRVKATLTQTPTTPTPTQAPHHNRRLTMKMKPPPPQDASSTSSARGRPRANDEIAPRPLHASNAPARERAARPNEHQPDHADSHLPLPPSITHNTLSERVLSRQRRPRPHQ